MGLLLDASRSLRKSKKLKREILHCVQNDKKRRFVILEEPTATKDLAFFFGGQCYLCKALLGMESIEVRVIL